MSAPQDRKIPQQNMTRVLERDRLVALTIHRLSCRRFWIAGAASKRSHAEGLCSIALPARARTALREPFTVDASLSDDRDVFDVDAPHQAVLPVTVPEVL